METGDVEADDGGDMKVSSIELSGSHRIPLHLRGRENGLQFPNCKSPESEFGEMNALGL